MKHDAVKKGKKVSFQLTTKPGSKVFVAGSFNGWNPTQLPMPESPKGEYKITMTLQPGRHEYKFVVNGEWILDPLCSDCHPNSVGSLNSVVAV